MARCLPAQIDEGCAEMARGAVCRTLVFRTKKDTLQGTGERTTGSESVQRLPLFWVGEFRPLYAGDARSLQGTPGNQRAELRLFHKAMW